MLKKLLTLLFLSQTIFVSLLHADLRMPYLFSDRMVMQQETGATVWGWGTAGHEVQVSFAGQNLKTTANAGAYWEVTFPGLEASAEGRDLIITSGEEKKIIHDVLVGEVWLASGQSNMEWRVEHTHGGNKENANANDPLLRVFTSANVARQKEQRNWWGKWGKTRKGKTKHFTAAGYYFGKRLRAELKVPVGIIECAWGGKPIEAFISDKVMHELPVAKSLIERKSHALAVFDPEKERLKFERKKAEFHQKLEAWNKDKKGKKPKGPRRPYCPQDDPNLHSTIYNGMIAPQVRSGIRGVIWYQGEANANGKTATIYGELLHSLVTDWRTRWGRDFSFYWVQLANFKKPTDKPGVESHWVTVQDEMRRALTSIPRSGMAVINDIGAANDIHPRNKKDVGERLARWALAKDYGRKDLVVSGPLYSGMEKKDQKLLLSFQYSKGLKSRDGGPLRRFEIAGEDGVWQWAQVVIEGEKVVVWNDKIPVPVKARYAWASNPEGANLINAAGLPASCFTTEVPTP